MSGDSGQEAGDYLDLVHRAYEMGQRDTDQEWFRATQPGSAAEKRWGPGGREHFGEPRETDYKGGPVPWDKEKEAGG